ncbi:MAG: sodium/solute symporter [Cyclobacteriaceae bacterium]|nr:sodium/solute symporter [Cyclobacteriaceae bacterium SS2]
MKNYILPLLTFLVSFSLSAERDINLTSQQTIGSLTNIEAIPGDEGLAGAFAGRVGDYLIFAGGTAFPNGKPWENGTKYFSDAILIFRLDGSLKEVDFSQKLPYGMGEGASVTVNDQLYCIGGLTADGLSDEVLRISYDGNLTINQMPKLPEPLKNVAATAIGNTVYAVGGEGNSGITTYFLSLDLTNPEVGWQQLPAFPKPLTAAIAVAQMDGTETSIHVIGGRGKQSGELLNNFYSSVFRYQPSKGQWEAKRDIRIDGTAIKLAATAAIPIGASHIVLVGGDNGQVFNRVEQAIYDLNIGDETAQKRRDSLWVNHTGFNDRVLVYNTVSDTWFNAGEWRGTPIAVAPAVALGKSVIVPGGEISPGVRNPEISQLQFSTEPDFGWFNYLVLILYFGGMLMLGFFFMKKESTTDEFFKAGGRIPWWAAGISILTTTLSAITFISIPAKAYASDWRMFMYNMSIILVVPVVITYFLPFFRRFKLDTAYEYLEIRFNRPVRWMASSLFVFFMVSRIAIVLFLPSLALNAVTGFSVYWAIIIMGVVTIIYCTSGGMEAVVWGDVIQGIILMSGAIIALGYMISGIDGGLGSFIDITSQQHKFNLLDFRLSLSEPVLWVVLIGGLANSLVTFTSDQSIVQRYMSTKDEKATGRSIWLNGILSVPVTIIFFLLGTALYAFYTSNPERLAITNPNIDSVFPQFIVSEMPVGISGLLIASIFAAAMSTLSSNINSVAAVVTSDFYKQVAKNSTIKGQMQVARWSGIVAGVFGMGMALILATWDIASLWDQFNTFVGLLTGGLGALFIMGIFFPRISGPAAFFGTLGSLAVLTFVKNQTDLSFLLYGLIGLASSILLGLLISIFLPNKKEVKVSTWGSRERE